MTLKDGIEEAYHQLGGIQWLVKLGQEEPRVFAGLLARLLPPTPPEDATEMTINIVGRFSNDDAPPRQDDDE
jgi:hypothetical protein